MPISLAKKCKYDAKKASERRLWLGYALRAL